MFDKNDPLVASVKKVMEQNEKERQAAKSVNEKFGIQDRKALPHQRQGEWDAAYKQALTEGVESLDKEAQAKKFASYARKKSKPSGPSGKKTIKEDEQLDELAGKGSLPRIAKYYDRLTKSKIHSKKDRENP